MRFAHPLNLGSPSAQSSSAQTRTSIVPDHTTNTPPKPPRKIIGKPFKKGVSGNPGGKPKELQGIQTEARKLSREAVKVLGKIMRDAKASGAARALAANSLLDRAYGKPPQLNTASAPEFRRAVDMTDEELERIIAGAQPAQPQPIAGEEEPLPDLDQLH
jgi:hypothetical protein